MGSHTWSYSIIPFGLVLGVKWVGFFLYSNVLMIHFKRDLYVFHSFYLNLLKSIACLVLYFFMQKSEVQTCCDQLPSTIKWIVLLCAGCTLEIKDSRHCLLLISYVKTEMQILLYAKWSELLLSPNKSWKSPLKSICGSCDIRNSNGESISINVRGLRFCYRCPVVSQ